MNREQLKELKDKLDGVVTDTGGSKLIFPSDLVSGRGDNTGHCVLIEPNIIRGHNVSDDTGTGSSNDGFKGYGSEIAIQNKNESGSLRNGSLGGVLYNKSGEQIVLPMPISLITPYVSNWQSIDMGALGRLGDTINVTKDGNLDEISSHYLQGASRTLAGAAGVVTQLPIKEYYELKTGTMENPYTEVMFRGVNNRTIPFSYTLTPKSLHEAEILRDIITKLKYHMMPEFKFRNGNNSYMLHPSTFDITFMNLQTGEENTWLHKISTCALTNLTVNGTPNGEYLINRGGSLASVQIDMFFTELSLLTKDNFLSSRGSY